MEDDIRALCAHKITNLTSQTPLSVTAALSKHVIHPVEITDVELQ